MNIRVTNAGLFMLLMVLAPTVLAAVPDFDLVRAGRPSCTLVLPDTPVKPSNAADLSAEMIDYRCRLNLHNRLKKAAKTLSEDVEAFTGAALPIVTESKNPTGNLILIGDTAQAKSMGLDDADLLAKHYVVIRASEDKLILNGRAKAYLDNEQIRRVRGYSGAAAAVYHFMDRHLGISHFAPGKIGREYPAPTNNLSIPGDLDVKFNPSVLFGGELGEIPDYHDYNRGGKYGSFLTYGGHSWIYQVPPEIYFDRENRPETYHPEYYALVNGRRITDAEHGGSLCTENPDVLRISAENIGKLFDSGVDVVEMGQPDSYDAQTACQCENCMAVGDTSPQGLGARITKFHVAIAEALIKTHPEKYVLHLMYGPSYHIPESYKGPLPKNMMLQYAEWGMGLFDTIQRYAHLQPAGITVYAYELTPFNPLGYCGPKSSVARMIELFEGVKKQRVQYIYWCGRAVGNIGMEGPQYWLAQQLQWDYNRDPEKLMEKYWTGYFHNAADETKAMYEYVDQRKEAIYRTYDRRTSVTSYQLFPALFDEQTNQFVAEKLAKAKDLAKSDRVVLRRIENVEAAYEFNKVTAACYKPQERFQASGDLEDLIALKKTVDKRTAYLDALRANDESGEYDDFFPPVLRHSWWRNKSIVNDLSRRGLFQGPFELDLDLMISHIRAHPLKRYAARKVDNKPDAFAWHQMEPVALNDAYAGSNTLFPTAVRAAWDDDNLYVHFVCHETQADYLAVSRAEKHDDKVWADDDVEVFVGHPTDNTKYYQFLVNAAGVQAELSRGWMRHEYDPEPMKPNLAWNGQWSATVDTSEAPQVWRVEIVIPFDTLGFSPKTGDTWRLNFGRYRPAKGESKDEYPLSWNPTFGKFGTTGRFGFVTFAD